MKYEDFVETTDLSNGNPIFYIFGMIEEAGEIAGICKRVMRGDYGEIAKSDAEKGHWDSVFNHPDVKLDLIKEKGDEHWYASGLLNKLGVNWHRIEKTNMDKLTKRQETNTIMGHGDNRECD